MKPRLKLSHDGGLVVIKRGQNPWGEVSARIYIDEHYGSMAAFAARYRLPYAAVRLALCSPNGNKLPGNVAKVRQVLGLPSRPMRYRATAAFVTHLRWLA